MPKETSKYRKETIDRICNLIRSDSYTVSEICSQVGIGETTYYEWKKVNSEFRELIKKAEEDFLTTMAIEAKRSLRKKVMGYDAEETKTVYCTSKNAKESNSDDSGDKKKLIVKERTVTTKHIPPDTAAVIFTLVNRDSDNWKNRQSQEITGKNGSDLLRGMKLVSGLSKDEIAKFLSDE